MNLLSIFQNQASKKVNLQSVDDGIHYNSALGDTEHEYIYSDIQSYNDWFEESDSAHFSLLCRSGSAVSLAIFFLNEKKEKIDSKIFPANQMCSFTSSPEVSYFRVALRIYGPSSDFLIALPCGSEEFIIESMAEYNSFNLQATATTNTYNNCVEKPLILLETLFCDTEDNNFSISKYLSYFQGLIHLIAQQSYKNFIWFIHISSDKGRAIDQVRTAIERVGLASNTVLNIYDHPANGYMNENETHIDRLRRPNSTYPELREKIFNAALKSADIQADRLNKEQLLVRVAIDDDDFVSPEYFEKLAELALIHSQDIDDQASQMVIGINRVWISYLTPGQHCLVHDVIFSRMMTGCKFSVSRGIMPMTPYAIHEKFDEVQATAGRSVPHKVVTLERPIFSYNRHGGNYSNQNKKTYYEKHISTHEFNSHDDLIEFIRTI